ncbi:MAG: SDR family NAD(P)-dependent oxidoreductase [Cyclobacteriaceae bacterium]
MNKIVSIFGCGWLGLPLAEHLMKEGYQVKGTTTTAGKIDILKQKGIEPYHALLEPDLQISGQDFFETDILIINIPPSTYKQGPDFHPRQIASLTAHTKQFEIEKILYISSTSVYPETNNEVDESLELSIENDRQKALLLAEKELLKTYPRATILRCGGLMGYDRQPVRFLTMSSLSKSKKSLDTPVNYIHRDDVVKIIKLLLKKECPGEIFNLVAPMHPLRKDFLKEINTEDQIKPSYKIVSSTKIVQFLGYSFIYPDPLNFDQQ